MKYLFILLFFSGLVPVLVSVPRKFYLIQQTMTWNDAQTYCRTNHQDLVTIESADDVAKLNKLGPSGWVGLYLNWRWSDGNKALVNPKFWSNGTSGNSLGCGIINLNGWWSAACNTTRFFLCYNDSYTGSSRYIMYSINYSWSQAQFYCRTHHTDLASDLNATEHSTILGVIGQRNTVWIGLIRHLWMWSDQSAKSYTPWVSGQPSYFVGPDSCGYFSAGGTFDSTCSNLMPFFCYRIITGQQQIVRVKVRSNQNLINATMDSMLEMIKLKLQDLGINGVMVTWKKQTDGDVFQK